MTASANVLVVDAEENLCVLYREELESEGYRVNTAPVCVSALRILEEYPGLAELVIEGGGDLAGPWEKEAARRGIAVRQIHGETWRRAMLAPSQRRRGEDAKEAADVLARAFIERSGAKRPTSLRHDAAEAILVGAWASGR